MTIPNRNVGDLGHTADHNAIAEVVNDLRNGNELFFGTDLTLVTTTVTEGPSIPGTQGTIVVGTRPLIATYGGYLRHSAAMGIAALAFFVDGANVPNSLVGWQAGVANQSSNVSRQFRLVLTPGSHTVELRVFNYSTGTASAVGNGGCSTFLSVVQV